MIVDPVIVAQLIAEIAAEEIMPLFGKLDDEAIKTKSSATDFVTKADIAAEFALKKALLPLTPGASFVGEEEVSQNPGLVNDLESDGLFWVVDPLDGTRNFVQGREEFGSIVALVRNGETIMGWIYGIPTNQSAFAIKNEGAFWNSEPLNGLPSAPSALTGLRGLGSLTGPYKERITANVLTRMQTHKFNCSAYAYLQLARGQFDFLLTARTHPWDHAAGVLILNALGGMGAYIDDDEIYTPRDQVGRPLLSAPSSDRFERARNEIMGENIPENIGETIAGTGTPDGTSDDA